MTVTQIDRRWFVVRDSQQLVGPFATNAAAWDFTLIAMSVALAKIMIDVIGSPLRLRTADALS